MAVATHSGTPRIANERGEAVADLHTHSSCSDGCDPPARVIERAALVGLETVALTDHDTTAGLEEARVAADRFGIELVDGIEMTARTPAERVVHILGFFVDPRSPAMNQHQQELGVLRRERILAILDRLQTLGVDLPADAVWAAAGGAPPGRPHVARALVRGGFAVTTRDAFRRWLRDGGGADVAISAPLATAVIARIHAASGVAVLAHPSASRVPTHEVRELARAGLDGIESQHPDHTGQERRRWARFAGEIGLAVSGGSDDHGGNRSRLGTGAIPREWVAALRARRPVSARAEVGA